MPIQILLLSILINPCFFFASNATYKSLCLLVGQSVCQLVCERPLLPLPNSLLPLPNSLLPQPNSSLPLPNSLLPLPIAQPPMTKGCRVHGIVFSVHLRVRVPRLFLVPCDRLDCLDRSIGKDVRYCLKTTKDKRTDGPMDGSFIELHNHIKTQDNFHITDRTFVLCIHPNVIGKSK